MRRMIAGLLLVGVGLLLATDGVAASTRSARPKRGRAAPAARRLEPRLEPRALEILHAMSWRLANARTLAFTAVATYESPSLLGPALAYTTTSQVFVQRPDKLRGDHAGRRPGVRVLLRRQDDDGLRAGREPGRGRRCAADDRRRAEGGLRLARAIYFPFTDVIVADPYGTSTEGLTHAFVDRAVARRRRHDDRHGGDRRRPHVRPDLDRRRGQAAAPDARGLSRRSRRGCGTRSTCRDWKLDGRISGGRLHVGAGRRRAAHPVRPAGSATSRRRGRRRAKARKR